MVGCQNYDLFLGTLNIRCRIIIGTPKGTIVLTTTHMYALNPAQASATSPHQDPGALLFQQTHLKTDGLRAWGQNCSGSFFQHDSCPSSLCNPHRFLMTLKAQIEKLLSTFGYRCLGYLQVVNAQKNAFRPEPIGTGLRGTNGTFGPSEASKSLLPPRMAYFAEHPCGDHDNIHPFAHGFQ